MVLRSHGIWAHYVVPIIFTIAGENQKYQIEDGTSPLDIDGALLSDGEMQAW